MENSRHFHHKIYDPLALCYACHNYQHKMEFDPSPHKINFCMWINNFRGDFREDVPPCITQERLEEMLSKADFDWNDKEKFNQFFNWMEQFKPDVEKYLDLERTKE